MPCFSFVLPEVSCMNLLPPLSDALINLVAVVIVKAEPSAAQNIWVALLFLFETNLTSEVCKLPFLLCQSLPHWFAPFC